MLNLAWCKWCGAAFVYPKIGGNFKHCSRTCQKLYSHRAENRNLINQHFRYYPFSIKLYRLIKEDHHERLNSSPVFTVDA